MLRNTAVCLQGTHILSPSRLGSYQRGQWSWCHQVQLFINWLAHFQLIRDTIDLWQVHWKLTVHVRNVIEPWFGNTLYIVHKFQQQCFLSQLFAELFKCCNSNKTHFLLSYGHIYKNSHRFCKLKKRKTKGLTASVRKPPYLYFILRKS